MNRIEILTNIQNLDLKNFILIVKVELNVNNLYFSDFI